MSPSIQPYHKMLDSIDDAADELKSAAQFALVSADRAMQRAGLDVAWLILVALAATIISFIYVRAHRRTVERKLDRHYIRAHYGDDLDTASKAYICLISLHFQRCNHELRNNDTIYYTRVFLIGADLSEEMESRVWDRRRESGLQDWFEHPWFVFRTIADAMHEANKYCTTIGRTKALCVFILISSRDPTIWGPQQHDAFAVPSGLLGHFYAIIGTGTENGRVAHRLHPSSTGPDGELLVKSLPLGPEKAGVTF